MDGRGPITLFLADYHQRSPWLKSKLYDFFLQTSKTFKPSKKTFPNVTLLGVKPGDNRSKVTDFHWSKKKYRFLVGFQQQEALWEILLAWKSYKNTCSVKIKKKFLKLNFMNSSHWHLDNTTWNQCFNSQQVGNKLPQVRLLFNYSLYLDLPFFLRGCQHDMGS